MRLDQAARCRAWRTQNPDRAAITRRIRKGLTPKVIPAWADHAKINAVYKEARRLTRETGIEHHVDHIVPLKGKTVTGLHVHHNLRIMVGIDNVRKGNTLTDDALIVPCHVSGSDIRENA